MDFKDRLIKMQLCLEQLLADNKQSSDKFNVPFYGEEFSKYLEEVYMTNFNYEDEVFCKGMNDNERLFYACSKNAKMDFKHWNSCINDIDKINGLIISPFDVYPVFDWKWMLNLCVDYKECSKKDEFDLIKKLYNSFLLNILKKDIEKIEKHYLVCINVSKPEVKLERVGKLEILKSKYKEYFKVEA